MLNYVIFKKNIPFEEKITSETKNPVSFPDIEPDDVPSLIQKLHKFN